MEPFISAKNLTRLYTLGHGSVKGLDSVNLAIPRGAMVTLKGVSGSGKSTLLSLLAGLDKATEGKLVVAGHDLNNASRKSLDHFRRKVVGMVFQNFNLMPTLDLMENVTLPALLAGKAFNEIQQKAENLLKWLNLYTRKHHLPSQLSGGEMQRTAIARAIINDPEVILADEPTGNLDSKNGTIVIELLTELNRNSGKTVIIATHGRQADEAATMRIQLKDGKIV